jgi:hypothetical protein
MFNVFDDGVTYCLKLLLWALPIVRVYQNWGLLSFPMPNSEQGNVNNITFGGTKGLFYSYFPAHYP